ncbi:MAG: hypothetical protein WDZ35_04870 [Crocinitomicaceae bacterium]
MKKLTCLLIVPFLLFGCNGSTEGSNASSEDKQEQAVEEPTIYTSALLLGLGGRNEDAKTYWIKFSNKGAEVDSMTDYYLSPQKDGFYIVQEVSAVKTVECDYTDYDGEQAHGTCSWEASQLLIAKPDNYKTQYQRKKKKAKAIAKEQAYCGEQGSDYEFPVLIGNGFVEYTFGGASSECSPDGPGGGFDKDTIIAIGSSKVSPFVAEYIDNAQLQQVYDQLNSWFKKDDGSLDSSSYQFFAASEMPLHFEYKNGQLAMYARNTYGRNHQDTGEETAFVSQAPKQFQSNEFPAYGEELVPLTGKYENYIISPVDSTYGVFNSEDEEVVFYTYPDKTELLRLKVGYASLIMVEWCDTAHIEKWDAEVKNSQDLVEY